MDQLQSQEVDMGGASTEQYYTQNNIYEVSREEDRICNVVNNTGYEEYGDEMDFEANKE